MRLREAAGFVIYRQKGDASAEYLLLRSAKHQEWGFPKGHKDESDQDLMTTALRELVEETGLSQVDQDEGFRCVLEYQVEPGKRGKEAYDKRVTYFLAKCSGEQEVILSSEHDKLAWVELERAQELLSYEDLVGCIGEAAKSVSK